VEVDEELLNRCLVGGAIWFGNRISPRDQRLFETEGLLRDGVLLLMGVPLAHLAVIAPWAAAIGALTASGHLTDDKRQEFILWSDTLGVSMLVDSIANAVPSGATESTVLGPFYVADSPLRELGADMAEQEAGVPAWVSGRVLDLEGRPLAGAELDVWQNGDNRLYAVQDPDAPDDHLRGRYRTDEQGRPQRVVAVGLALQREALALAAQAIGCEASAVGQFADDEFAFRHRVRQRARDNDRHGVIEKRSRYFFGDVD